MAVVSCFYDVWKPRYLKKRKNGIIKKVVKCQFFDISSIISASRHRKSMKQLPFDSSQFDGSNGGIFRFLRPIDAEIFGETSKWRSTGSVKCRFVDISSIISASRHRRSMKQLPFDSSQFDGSNGGIIRFLRSSDAEIFDKTLCKLLIC